MMVEERASAAKQLDCETLRASFLDGAELKRRAFEAMRAAERDRDRLRAELEDMERGSRGLSQLVFEAEREDSPAPYDRGVRGRSQQGRDRTPSMRIIISAQRFILGAGATITLEYLKMKWAEYEDRTHALRSAARDAELRFQNASQEALRQQGELSRTAKVMRDNGCRVSFAP